MTANLLSANQDKNQLMLVSQEPTVKTAIRIPNVLKDIEHKSTMLILGTLFHDSLKWNQFLCIRKMSLLNQLKSRTNAVKLLRASTKFPFANNLINGMFQGKFMYSM
jgi:hypothetical protein